mmetsp:Transcript_81722/g.144187  ORF Transcript_81722/g.144187 Transcript_81722/m.144187 type:complete len:333 (+) Transcript_81722:899-1897(+)
MRWHEAAEPSHGSRSGKGSVEGRVRGGPGGQGDGRGWSAGVAEGPCVVEIRHTGIQMLGMGCGGLRRFGQRGEVLYGRTTCESQIGSLVAGPRAEGHPQWEGEAVLCQPQLDKKIHGEELPESCGLLLPGCEVLNHDRNILGRQATLRQVAQPPELVQAHRPRLVGVCQGEAGAARDQLVDSDLHPLHQRCGCGPRGQGARQRRQALWGGSLGGQGALRLGPRLLQLPLDGTPLGLDEVHVLLDLPRVVRPPALLRLPGHGQQRLLLRLEGPSVQLQGLNLPQHLRSCGFNQLAGLLLQRLHPLLQLRTLHTGPAAGRSGRPPHVASLPLSI